MGIPHNNPASGAVDGVNRVFKTQVKVGPGIFTEVPYTLNTTAVFYNGKALTGEHIEGPGTDEVTLDFAPLAGEPSDLDDEGDTIRIFFLDTTAEGLISEFLVDVAVTLELEQIELTTRLASDDEVLTDLQNDEIEMAVNSKDDQALGVGLSDPEIALSAIVMCVGPD